MEICNSIAGFNLTNPGKLSDCDGISRTRLWESCSGTNCPQNLPYLEIQPCNNGFLTQWGKLSQCLENKTKRTRTCIPETNGGKPCPDEPLEEIQECNNGFLTEWGKWSQCVNNKSKRTRTCVQPVNGTGCPDEALEEIKDCKVEVLSDKVGVSNNKDFLKENGKIIVIILAVIFLLLLFATI
jgi:hypothetical protein